MNNTSLSRENAILFLGVGYFALAAISIAASMVDGGLSAIWLANAFAVVWILVRSIKLPVSLAVVAAASMAMNLISGLAFTAAAFASLLNLFEIVSALVVLRWWMGNDVASRPETPEQSVAFFAIAAVGAPLLTAFIAGPALSLVAGWPIATVAYQWFSASFLGAALVIPPMVLAGSRNAEPALTHRRSLLFAATAAGVILVACVALGSYIYPFFAIGLYLLATTIYLTRFEVALLATIAGVVAIIVALSGLIPGFETGAAAFSDRFQISLGFALVFPVFVSILLWRIRCHQKQLAESEELFRRAMEDSAIGMAIVELGGRINRVNHRFAEMLGYTAEELADKTFFELSHPGDRHLGFRLTKEAIAGRVPSFRYEKRYLRKDGSPVWTQVSGTVIWDEGSERPRHIVAQIENIDERMKAQRAIVEAENRWNFALTSARQGVWDLDLRQGKTYYSPMWKEMLGYAEDELGDDPGLWLSLIHPDDRQRALELETAHLDGQTQFFEAEFRMRHKDGSWIWVLDRGKTIERDADGRTVRAIGTHTDISAQKRAQVRLAEIAAALRAEKERLRVTLHAIGDAVICTDAAENVSFMNSAAEALTGRTADESIGRPLSEIYCPRDEETNERISVTDQGAGSEARAHNRAVIMRPDGTRSSIRQIVSPIVTEGRVMNGSVIVFQDVTDARTLQRQLAYAASHDSLTGLANRASFLATMRELVDEVGGDEAAQHQLLFIDLDRFKAVNDSAGHGAGDALLKKIAIVLRDLVLGTDSVARLGGDEFALVLKHSDVDTAVRVAKQIVTAISEIEFSWEGKQFRVGASIGIAAITADCKAVDEVIANADRSCYAAKSAGRGTVSIHKAKAA